MSNLRISPGRYFDTGSNMRFAFCGHPKLCLEVKGSRVYFRRHYKDPERAAETASEPPEYCSKSSVNYVRETAEEMLSILDLSNACSKSAEAYVVSVKKEFMAKVVLVAQED